MNPDDFAFAAQVLKTRTGLVLTRDKGYLLENRLMPVVRQNNFKGIADLIGAWRAGKAELEDAVVDAMMVKDTAFFRDWKPFVHFSKIVLPNALATRKAKRALRILCAGVSTGQEAYSMAMLVREAQAKFSGWQIDIAGIDISSSAIAAAELGFYSQFDVQRGLPIRSLLRHFLKEEEGWRLNGDIRAMVKFQVWNLLDDVVPLGRFDVILCRNVLIYLDLQAKIDLLQRLGRVLADDGVLYVGTQDSLSGLSMGFRPVNRDLGIYAPQRAEKILLSSLAVPVRR